VNRRGLAFGVILAGLLLMPSSALADRHHYVIDPGYTTQVSLRGTHGYRISVYAGNRRSVGLMVHKGGMRTEYRARQASYGKYGTIARFPGFGEIRFRFMANGRSHPVSPAPWCEGPDGQLLEGRVVGGIRFVGEEKYTSVSVRRAKAEVETWPRMRCRDREPDGRRRARRLTATFYAFNNARPNIIFSVKRYSKRFRPASRQVEFGVYTASIGNGVAIYRSFRVTADRSTVVVPDPKGSPENVLFRPPPPFSGTATFQRDPESVFTWEGDMGVQFPGIEPLLLTGPTFTTEYCAQSGCAHQEVAE
jgi:hypothetical protein